MMLNVLQIDSTNSAANERTNRACQRRFTAHVKLQNMANKFTIGLVQMKLHGERGKSANLRGPRENPRSGRGAALKSFRCTNYFTANTFAARRPGAI